MHQAATACCLPAQFALHVQVAHFNPQVKPQHAAYVTMGPMPPPLALQYQAAVWDVQLAPMAQAVD